MATKDNYLIRFYKNSLHIVFGLYLMSCFISLIFFASLKIFGLDNEIQISSLFILGMLFFIYAAIFYMCYRKVISKSEFNMKYYKITKQIILGLTYFHYLYLNFTMHINSQWLTIFFFILIGVLFFDLKMIIESIILSIISLIIVFCFNFSALTSDGSSSLELIMKMVAIMLTLGGIFIIGLFASKLLNFVQINASKVTEENSKLENLFKDISKISDEIFQSSDNLSSAITQQSSSLQEISSNSQEVTNNSMDMLDKSNENTKILNELLESNEIVVTETAESNNKIKELMENTNKNKESLNNALGIIINISQNIKNTFNATKELEEKSKQVDSILSIIGEISEQTNLLALNASIEAARAGEAGKGFAVVADEIRNLSEGTKNSLEQISEILEKLKNNISVVQKQMKDNNSKSQEGESILKESVSDLNKVVENLTLFASNISEISIATDKVLQNTKNTVKFNEEISKVTNETMSKYELVYSEIEESTSTNEEIEQNILQLRKVAQDMKKLTE